MEERDFLFDDENLIDYDLDNVSETEILKEILSIFVEGNNLDLAQRLIDRFGSIKNIFETDVDDLMSVKGVNENIAIFFSLNYKIKSRISENKNANSMCLSTTKKQENYVSNILRNEKLERIVIINLDEKMKVINYHLSSVGTSNISEIDSVKFMKIIKADNPSFVIIAHNHPQGEPFPSDFDVNFTLNVRDSLKNMNTKLIDHIIFSPNGIFSFKNDGLSKYII